jgi:signal peptidase I
LFFAVCCGVLLLFGRSTFGWQALSVPTGSMRPTFSPGALVIVHRVPISSLKVGDVITYTNPLNMRTTLTHRIVKTYKLDGKVPAFITKGDANPSPDVPVVGGLVQGKMLWHVPAVGAWLMWSKTWAGIAVLVYLPALLLMLEEVRRLAAYYKLSLPYRAYALHKPSAPQNRRKYALGGAVSLAVVLNAVLFWQPALALLRSNNVALTNNTISVAATPPSCTGNSSNSTNVTVVNGSSQTATSGNASSSSGSATSGNASNSNSSSTTITINNGC